MVDEAGQEAFAWEQILTDEILLGPASRCQSEPRGSKARRANPPPSLPAASPKRASAPRVAGSPRALLEGMGRNAVMQWLASTQNEDDPAANSPVPVRVSEEVLPVVNLEEEEIPDEPTGSKKAPSQSDPDDERTSLGTSIDSDCYPGLDRFLGEENKEASVSSEESEEEEAVDDPPQEEETTATEPNQLAPAQLPMFIFTELTSSW